MEWAWIFLISYYIAWWVTSLYHETRANRAHAQPHALSRVWKIAHMKYKHTLFYSWHKSGVLYICNNRCLSQALCYSICTSTFYAIFSWEIYSFNSLVPLHLASHLNTIWFFPLKKIESLGATEAGDFLRIFLRFWQIWGWVFL